MDGCAINQTFAEMAVLSACVRAHDSCWRAGSEDTIFWLLGFTRDAQAEPWGSETRVPMIKTFTGTP